MCCLIHPQTLSNDCTKMEWLNKNKNYKNLKYKFSLAMSESLSTIQTGKIQDPHYKNTITLTYFIA